MEAAHKTASKARSFESWPQDHRQAPKLPNFHQRRVFMVRLKKILVPLGPETKDLKGLHYALALAGRIQASVFVLKLEEDAGPKDLQAGWLEDSLKDLVNSARQAGLGLSYLAVRGNLEDEVTALVEAEGIDLVILGEVGTQLERSLKQVHPRLHIQFVQVTGKDHIDYV